MNTIAFTRAAIGILGSLLLSGCPSAPPTSATPAAHTPQAAVFECTTGLRATVYPGGEAITLVLPEQAALTLPRVIAASGEKYEANGSLFWSKGNNARIEHAGQIHDDCRLNRETSATLKDLRFRATGNEPGWRLDIDREGRLQLLANYGADTVNTVAIAPISNGRDTWVYDSEDDTLQVRVQEKPCADSMADQTFPATVSLRWQNQTLNGCGYWLPGWYR